MRLKQCCEEGIWLIDFMFRCHRKEIQLSLESFASVYDIPEEVVDLSGVQQIFE